LEETVNHRIKQVIKHYELNPNSFSVRLGMRDTTIRNILKERNKPSYDVIIKIISTFVDISPIWLLQGNGEMLLADEQKRLGIKSGDTKMLSSSNASFELDHIKKTARVSEPKAPYYAKKQTVQFDIIIEQNEIKEISGVRIVESKEFDL